MIRLAIYRAPRRRRFINHGSNTTFFDGGWEWSLAVFGWVLFLNILGHRRYEP